MAGPTNVERGQAVRGRLLAAAQVLIGEIGWNGVSTRILAERAGLRSGLVHYHFESLQALLRQAALEAMQGMLAESAAMLSSTADPADAIDAMLVELDRYTGDDPVSLLFMEAYLTATRDPVLHQGMRALVDDFRGAVERALARGGHEAPEAAAVVVMAVFDGYLLHKGMNPGLSAALIGPELRKITRADGVSA